MILSMTGYGDARLEEDGLILSLEIRSVNNKWFKAGVRLPERLAFLEPEIERLLRRRVTRGTLTCSVKSHLAGPAAAQSIDTAVLEAYLSQLGSVRPPEGVALTLDLGSLLGLPGVCRPRDDADDADRLRTCVERLVEQALDRLLLMRRTEGSALWADLELQCSVISQRLEEVARRAPQVAADHRTRLAERVGQMLAESGASLRADDLVRETALFADRCDISEEMTRLRGHVEQFRTIGAAEDAAGRKLEFLSQEMLREVNTIGSKANDGAIARLVVEMKSAVDRIKEQVANVE